MGKQQFFNSIEIEGNKDIDSKYRVADDAARDLLILENRIKKGHVIYHEADSIRYELKEYPTDGSITGVIWEKVTRPISDSIELDDSNTAASSKAINDLRSLLELDIEEARNKFENLPVYASMQEANQSLGAGKFFRYDKNNIDGVPSPNSSIIAKT